MGTLLSPSVVEGLIYAAKDLIFAPSDTEAAILSDLGRSSFALELAIQAPKDTLLHQVTLPQKIYLDASVLLPAITPGHPYYEIYRESVERLIEASDRASIGIQVLAFYGFLNEVVSHRRIAMEAVREMGDHLLDDLRRQARLCGTAGMNVYLGAYSNKQLRDRSLDFQQFLSECAPYETEGQLADWLRNKGIRIIADDGMTGEGTRFAQIYHRLETAFADDLVSGRRRAILIRHDAIQLVALDEDRKRGVKSIFVTADRSLRDHIGSSPFGSLADCMMSHVGMAQFVELMIGPSNSGFNQTMSRLLWTAKASSEFEAARNYFIDVALEKYDEGLAMNMGDVVDRVAQSAANEAARKGIHLTQPDEVSRLPATRLLEQYEDGFIEEIRKLIERNRQEQ